MDPTAVIIKLLSLGIEGFDLYDAILAHQNVLNPIFAAAKAAGRTTLTEAEWQQITDYEAGAKAAETDGITPVPAPSPAVPPPPPPVA